MPGHSKARRTQWKDEGVEIIHNKRNEGSQNGGDERVQETRTQKKNGMGEEGQKNAHPLK
jgi:hypothetical protein